MTRPPNEQKSQEQLVTEAVNTHGNFFKRAIRNELEKIQGVEILGEEYPVANYLQGGAIDLLALYSQPRCNTHFVLSIECKRAYVASKQWIFFESPDLGSKLFYSFKSANVRVTPADDVIYQQYAALCIEGIQIELGDQKAKADPEPIWKAANQTCKGALGFLNQELQERRSMQSLVNVKDFHMCPVIVTSAPLFICPLSSQNVDLLTGNHEGIMQRKSADQLILHHPFTPCPEDGAVYERRQTAPYASHAQRSYDLKEAIFVVNSAKLKSFFNMLFTLGRVIDGRERSGAGQSREVS